MSSGGENVLPYICVECGENVPDLYKSYSKGNSIKLSICGNCNNTCDKYVEMDSVMIALDLILYRPQVYRHVIFNTSKFLSAAHIKMLFIFTLLSTYSLLYQMHPENALGQPILNIQMFILTAIQYVAYIFGLVICNGIACRQFSTQIFKFILYIDIIASFGELMILIVTVWNYDPKFLMATKGFVILSRMLAFKVGLKLDIKLVMLYFIVSLCFQGLLAYHIAMNWGIHAVSFPYNIVFSRFETSTM